MVSVKLINMLDLAVIPSNQRLVFLQTNQSLRRLKATLNFAVDHCKEDIWKQNVFGHSKLPNKTGVFALVTMLTHFFYRMFPYEVSEKFSVGRTKMSYIVRHGLSEVLRNELVDDIKASIGTFTLLLDQTTTSQVKKQCGFLIRYWSESEAQDI